MTYGARIGIFINVRLPEPFTYRVCVKLLCVRNTMTPQDTLALKANQNDDFNKFYAFERILEKESDPFKALETYERFERRSCRQKSA